VAEEFNSVRHEPAAQDSTASLDLIIKLRGETQAAGISKASTVTDRSTSLAKRTGIAIQLKRRISDTMLASHVELAGASREQVLERLRQDPQVEYVALDRRRYPHATNPNDALFSGQWYLKATEVSAVNAINAWDEGQGTNGVIVAVLDTGVLYDHPDLGRGDHGGKLLPGYDFVSGVAQANDDTGRDADPSDPGGWSEPVKLLDGVGWYPQILGFGQTGTDTYAGRIARLYIFGVSGWEIVFERPPAQ